jgi:propanol-preferring alcohol dehydrogenase
MASMRAQVLHRWGEDVAYEEVPVPAPGPDEALIRVEACGVGLTVLNYMQGQLGRPEALPRIPGHEAVGTVVGTGPGVARIRAGDRVMAYFYLTCGRCDFCRIMHEPLCRDFRGNVGVACNGGYAEYLALPAANFLPVPPGIEPVAATAIPDAIATSYHACQRAGIGPGDIAVVFGGGGGVGIHMLQMVRAFGGDAIAVELGELKLQAARAVGAIAAIAFDAPNLIEQVRAIAPRGVTVAIDFVGRPETLGCALEMLGRRGRLLTLTTFSGVTFPVSPRTMVQNELSILGSRYASRWDVAQAARLVVEGRIRPVVSETVPLAEVRALHDKLRRGALIGRGAVIC